MLRKTSFFFSLLLLLSSQLAAVTRGKPEPTGIDPLLGTELDLDAGPHASGHIYTNEVVYLVNDPISLRMSMMPAGHVQPKAFFLYLLDLQTGKRRYVNTEEGLLPEGEVTDIVGNDPDDPEPLAIPMVEDLTLLGDGGVFGAAMTASAELLGNHEFVMELRDVSGRFVSARFRFGFTIVEQVVPVVANITADTVWTSNNAYLLDSIAVFVQNGATLTVQPGTYVLGVNLGTLVVARGAKINARGTELRPIVMTSGNSVGQRARADWGGLILNGNSIINVPGGEASGEGETGLYGGNDPNDSSGVLAYLRVEFAGFEFSPDNELNGIAFQGVGAGTEVNHIQVHFNLDDGIEMFGGTVNLKYVLLTSNADDSLDYTQGWIGAVQFVVIQQRGDDADQGFECDNNGNNNDLMPRAHPNIWNATAVGAPTNEEGNESDQGALLREGTAGTWVNLIIMGFKEDAIDIDHPATFAQVDSGELTVSNSIFFRNGGAFGPGDCIPAAYVEGDNVFGCEDGVASSEEDLNDPSGGTAEFIQRPEFMNRFGDPGLRRPFDTWTPDFRPRPGSMALDVNYVAQPPDVLELSDGRVLVGFFSPVNFVGGEDPFAPWTQASWTYFGPY